MSNLLKGVLDRIEEDQAVILIEENKEQFILPATDLPSGSEPGTWFTLLKKGDSYEIVAIDAGKTEAHFKRIRMLQRQLQKRRKPSKFKRNK